MYKTKDRREKCSAKQQSKNKDRKYKMKIEKIKMPTCTRELCVVQILAETFFTRDEMNYLENFQTVYQKKKKNKDRRC